MRADLYPRQPGVGSRRAELCLWAVGLLGAAYAADVALGARLLLSNSARAGSTAKAAERADRYILPDQAVMARMEIPALRVAVAVMNDDDPQSLARGIGHIRGTALPGGLGTVGLAGHRDTFLRPVRNVARGMEIRLSDASGTYHYVVDTTEIVKPEAVEVLAIQDRPELALVTCYPFNYIGAAPKRFVVHAHLVSVAADERAAVR